MSLKNLTLTEAIQLKTKPLSSLIKLQATIFRKEVAEGQRKTIRARLSRASKMTPITFKAPGDLKRTKLDRAAAILMD
jgi:hypothetical protein